MRAHPDGYTGVNLGETTNAQNQAQQWASVRMQQRKAHCNILVTHSDKQLKLKKQGRE
jgi:hypothetical protein